MRRTTSTSGRRRLDGLPGGSYCGDASNPNVAFVYEILGVYRQGDEQGLRGFMHPQAEIHGAAGLINAGTRYGYDGFREWLRQWNEALDEISYELGEPIEVDESVIVVSVHVVGVGAASGLRIDAIFGWLFEWDNGLLRRFHAYPGLDGALDAARRIAAERV
jgi:SnoaL-like domain